MTTRDEIIEEVRARAPRRENESIPPHLDERERRVWTYNDMDHPEDRAIRDALSELSRTRDALVRLSNGVVRDALGYKDPTPLNVDYVIDLVRARVQRAETSEWRLRAALARARLWLSAHAMASRWNGVALREEIAALLDEGTPTSLGESSDDKVTDREDKAK